MFQQRKDSQIPIQRMAGIYTRILAGEMTIAQVDQLWAADIAYTGLRTEFVYRAAVLNACSLLDAGKEMTQEA